MKNRDSNAETSPAPSTRQRLSSTASPAAAERILVVDDDEDIRNIFAEVLRTSAYDVHCAEDGEAGWTAFSEMQYDLLITDHEMPRLTGGELLRRIRAQNDLVPVILISGKLVWPDADLLHVLPPGLAMEKPFSWPALLANVRRLLTPGSAAGAPPDDPTLPLVEPRDARADSRVGRHKTATKNHP